MRTSVDITLYLAADHDRRHFDITHHLATGADLNFRLQVSANQISPNYTINDQLPRKQEPTFDFEIFCYKRNSRSL